jgi:hypothetical protein
MNLRQVGALKGGLQRARGRRAEAQQQSRQQLENLDLESLRPKTHCEAALNPVIVSLYQLSGR